MSSSSREVGIVCLHCGAGNFTPNRDSIDSWNCGYCHSGFLSLTMLNNLAPAELMEQIKRPREQTTNTPRNCPMCPSRMDELRVFHGGKGVRLDVCRRCKIAWFDSGELLRTLRYRAPDADPNLDQPMVGVRRHLAPKTVEAPVPVAWLTYGFMAICLAMAPAAVHSPQLIERYAFWTMEPWRQHGLTFLTSLFLHDGMLSALVSIFSLWVFGVHAERRLGTDRYFLLFVASGAVSRLVYAATGLAGVVRDQPLAYGPSAPISALIAYWLCTRHLGQKREPGTKFKESGPPVLRVLAALTGIAFWFTANFFKVAISHSDADHFDMSETLLPQILQWLHSPQAYAYLAAILIGAVWGASEDVSRRLPSGKADDASGSKVLNK